MKKIIFCANEQADTEHTFTLEGTGHVKEIVARCVSCARVVKFPGDVNKEQLASLISAHREANQGHIPAPTKQAVEAELKKLEELLTD